MLDHAGRSHDAGNVEYNYDKENVSGAKIGKVSLSRVPIPGRKKSAADRDPHTIEDLQEILVDQVAQQIAEKLGNTKKTVEVEVAVGDDHLNRVADLMESRLWSRALDELDKTPEFPKPASEAYRQYDLGLAHEAMAYDAKVFKDQETDLFAAQEYYDKALELNRKEKYFVLAVARIKDSLGRYKAFEGMQKEEAKQQAQRAAAPAAVPAAAPAAPPAVAAQNVVTGAATVRATAPKTQVASAKAPAASGVTGQNAPPSAPKALAPQTQVASAKPQTPAAQNPRPTAAKAATPPSAPAKPQSKTLGIGDVIEMFTSGVPEGQIVDIIQHSTVQFDPLDKDTAIAIARARLSLTLQNEMRKRVGAPLLGPAKPAGGK